jgi:hypothetical protein
MTNDLDTQIRSGLERLASNVVSNGVASDDVLNRIAERRTSRRRARRIGAAACLVAVIGGAAALAATIDLDSDDSHVATDPEVVTDTSFPPDAEAPNATISGPEAPLSPRNHAATAWTGTELVIWGGAADHEFSSPSQIQFSDGAAYDPVSDTWRAMAPGPITRQTERPVAVATGSEIVVFSGRTTAAWLPSSNSWRELPDAPAPVGQAVWTGEEIVVASTSITTSERDVVAALDLADGTWRSLSSPGAMDETVITWTGKEVITLGRQRGLPLGSVEGRAFDPSTNTWRDLPTGPLQARGFGATWVDDRVVVVNYRSEAATYDPTTDSWMAIPPLPTSFGEVWVTPIAIGEHVVIDAGGLVFIGDRSGAWTPVGPPMRSWRERVVPIGDNAALRVAHVDNSPMLSDRPSVQRLDLGHLLAPEVLWLGSAQLVLADDIAFERQALIGDPSQWQHTGVVTTVRVDHQECTITERFGETTIGVPAGDPVEIVPLHSGGPWTGYLQDDGRTLRLAEGSVRLECDDPDHTIALARALVLDESAYDEARRQAHRAVQQALFAEFERQRQALEAAELERRRREAESSGAP